MNKVAVLIGKESETISFSDSGTLKVFLKKQGRWEVIDEILLSMHYEMGIKGAREQFLNIAKHLGDCRIVVGKKVDGIAYNTFEAMKYSIWEFDGKPEMFLDYIIEKETEAKSAVDVQGGTEEIIYIEKLSDTYYVIDLEEVQSSNRNISSKQALMPVLEKAQFRRLDILCSHIPPWIENQVEKYQLKMETEIICSGGYKVSLFAK